MIWFRRMLCFEVSLIFWFRVRVRCHLSSVYVFGSSLKSNLWSTVYQYWVGKQVLSSMTVVDKIGRSGWILYLKRITTDWYLFCISAHNGKRLQDNPLVRARRRMARKLPTSGSTFVGPRLGNLPDSPLTCFESYSIYWRRSHCASEGRIGRMDRTGMWLILAQLFSSSSFHTFLLGTKAQIVFILVTQSTNTRPQRNIIR